MYIYIYVIYCMYILFCNRAPWKNSLTEWSTLYKYIWNKKIKKVRTHLESDFEELGRCLWKIEVQSNEIILKFCEKEITSITTKHQNSFIYQ